MAIAPKSVTIQQVAGLAEVATKTVSCVIYELIIEHSPRRRGWPTPVPRRLLEFELILRNSTAPPAQGSPS